MAGEGTEIAIIGSGCRFPGNASSPSKLWALLRDPTSVASKVPALGGYYHEDALYHGHANVKEAYLLAGDETHRRFDAAFFGIKPSEANVLDPQVRLLLETVYEALEDGGQPIDSLRGSDTAVYAGQMVNDYELLMYRDHENLGRYHATGTSRTMLSNRVSFFFDWHGPSMTIDTACSSSLVALHNAVQQLQSGHSRVAIVAGSNLIHDVGSFIAETNLQMLSPNGQSRMWDADADGYARGEGVAAVVLKTREAAEADGDHIECIIRGTAVNQDGKTPGQTMPSASAQAQLIRDCYARAGLDLTNVSHRPQYFEAHGTGTPAGDPIEAEAISSAFYSDVSNPLPMSVGSIKTVVGHTEGTAGIAGLLKASLALQNKLIPPNLLFNTLNPRIKPFYDYLHVPTALTPWPSVASGCPRRASVNSFGFGGTNAHAILESYIPPVQLSQKNQVPPPVYIPFVFSAFSEASLKSYLAVFSTYLRENKTAHDLRDIAYSLDARRTRHQVVTTISASTADELCEKVEKKLELSRADSDQRVGVRSTHQTAEARKPLVLGVFTGQGAQWAQMGLELITTSAVAKSTLESLQKRLDQLPDTDRPSWSLVQELERDSSSSHVMEAKFSQPLCTAIQILQVNLLRAAGIEFTAVVGHSSGEIAAAYAAGFISAEDAICIAYYRGLYSSLAQGLHQKSGAMMAVGTSCEDAEDLLGFPEFEGRACVAAVNSATSVTISGDKDALEELKIVFEDENKQARFLKVDKAYHSHHMKECSAKYLESLAALNIQVGPGSQTSWFSSVYESEINGQNFLKGPYWDENMVKPVLFMQAVDNACASKRHFDLAIELGPHPALKGPALQTIQERFSQQIPYTGLFTRGVQAITAFSEGLGYCWTHLGQGVVSLQSYDNFIAGNSDYKLVKGLPSYAWDHENEYWHETRYARAMRLRPGPVHDLLGHLTPNSTDQDMRWRQFLRLPELKWVTGHRLQNLTVFPAAGYIVSVVEAAMSLCKDASVTLIEVLDVDIDSALVFDNDDVSIEAIISLTGIVRRENKAIEADFKYHATSGKGTEPLKLKASGRVRIHLGQASHTALPPRALKLPNLVSVSEKKLYDSLSELGYQYTGQFASLERIERKLGAATGFISIIEPSKFLIHPGALDAAFQSTHLTYAAPEDGASRSIYIPRRIKRLTFNPDLCILARNKQTDLAFDAAQPIELPHANKLCDIDLYPDHLDHAMIRVQGLECVPFSRQTAKDDGEAFSNIVWNFLDPDVQAITRDHHSKLPSSLELAGLLERVAGFYLRSLEKEVPESHPSRYEAPYKGLLQYASNISSQSCATRSQLTQAHWDHDTAEVLAAVCEPYADSIDMKLVFDYGKNLASSIMGENTAGDVSGLMQEWYRNGFGVKDSTTHLARVLKQIVHRYPQMHVLEVGPEAGAATNAILTEIGPKFASYTVAASTENSFDPEQALPDTYKAKVAPKVLNLAKNPRDQGFTERSFDVVVASLIMHQSSEFEQSLRNARRLLKPGGQLIVLELQPSLPYFLSVVFGAYSHQWFNAEEGKTSFPAITLLEWDSLLRKTGFSGIDTSTVEQPGIGVPLSIFVSQAMDEKIAFLREPLSTSFPISSPEPTIQDLLILGGNSLKTARLVSQLSTVLKEHCGSLRTAHSMGFVDNISPKTIILSLTDLDASEFKQLDELKWDALKKIVSHTGTLVWVTHGRLADNPHANMMLGLLRGAARDNSTLDYLLLDVEEADRMDHNVIAEAILRHKAASQWRESENLSYSVESELVMDKTGRFLVPRLMMNEKMNDRYNSNWREIREPARPGLDNIAISTSESGWDVVLEPLSPRRGVQMRATHSLLSPIRVAGSGCMYVSLSSDVLSGDKVISLSSKNNSVICPQEELSVPVKVPTGSEARLLWLTAHYLLASSILKGLSEDDQVLVHEPSLEFSIAIAEEASMLGVEVTFTTTNNDTPDKWIVIHPFSSEQSALVGLADENFSIFVDMTPRQETESVADLVATALPAHCRKESLKSLFGNKSWIPKATQKKEIQRRLLRAVSWASGMLTGSHCEGMTSLAINVLPETVGQLEPFAVIEWDTVSEVSVKVQPVDTLVSFSDKKTYWLVGLTGGLGLSLCEWMVRRGARYFVISSRKPNVESAWVDGMHKKGVTVKLSACDLTQKDQVEELYSEICSSMPGIGGVAQGAMILEDVAIQNMTLEQLSRVTKPKVDGSIYLNELFQENTLDFFVFFSSVSSVVGNHGQANYAAANTFMASLAEQRRRKGLAASVMDIGAVFGVGYITRSGNEKLMGKVTLQSGGYVRTSERDFHQLFGEAVLAGKPGSTGPIELVSGVRRISQREENRPVWETWPRMSHFIMDHEGPEDTTDSSNKAHIPVKVQLAEARNNEETYEVVWNAFVRKLQSLFQIDITSLTKAELGAMRLDQMGIDSLTAVEIRGWLMKTFEVNLPVLKILNGISVGELVDTATEAIPSHLVPNLAGCSAEQTSSQDSDSSQDMASSSGTAVNNPFDSDQMGSSHSDLSSDQEYATATDFKSTVLKSIPVSFTQARFYPSGLFLEDKVGLNHIAWARFTGEVSPERLQRALRSLSEQHEILRTAFFDQAGKQMQHILETSPVYLERKQIQTEDEVTELVKSLQKEYVYDVARGETMRVILLSRSATENYLILGVHPLVLDATSFQIYLKWLTFYYTSPNKILRVKQFAESSEQRHADYAAGKFEVELQFWKNEFLTPIKPLPLLTVAKVDERPKLKAYENIRASLTIDVDTKTRVLEICRRIRATPFHFYLAVLRVLLLQYSAVGSNSEDVTIAVAENGRGYDAEEMDVIGPLYNLVLVRLLAQRSTSFEDLLETTRNKTYAALSNSKLPYPMLVEELGLQRTAKDYPFVQVFADYRVGQRTTIEFGENNGLVMMGFDFKVPYDVFLDTIDEPEGECLHELFLRNDLFGKDEAERLARSYKSLVVAFAGHPAMTLGQAALAESECGGNPM